MCSCEWPGRLKCLAKSLDRSDPLFFTSSKCSRKQSPNLRPDSPMWSLLQRAQVMQYMVLEVVQPKCSFTWYDPLDP